MKRARSTAGVSLQAGRAAAAACTVRSISSGVQNGTRAWTRPVEGLKTSPRCSPADVTSRPPTRNGMTSGDIACSSNGYYKRRALLSQPSRALPASAHTHEPLRAAAGFAGPAVASVQAKPVSYAGPPARAGAARSQPNADRGQSLDDHDVRRR